MTTATALNAYTVKVHDRVTFTDGDNVLNGPVCEVRHDGDGSAHYVTLVFTDTLTECDITMATGGHLGDSWFESVDGELDGEFLAELA